MNPLAVVPTLILNPSQKVRVVFLASPPPKRRGFSVMIALKSCHARCSRVRLLSLINIIKVREICRRYMLTADIDFLSPGSAIILSLARYVINLAGKNVGWWGWVTGPVRRCQPYTPCSGFPHSRPWAEG